MYTPVCAARYSLVMLNRSILQQLLSVRTDAVVVLVADHFGTLLQSYAYHHNMSSQRRDPDTSMQLLQVSC
jgi:hypothetical protein